ncbi:MFS transporter [Plantactinospora endophytica]|uniref:MFS transporter n=1 Tax=Plantactinospora endophytica TaxID=673535 RepID=A0ABQ4E753_9ACTN|nr:MFS transporter [Plantactinospora endophytica]GIG90513.1 MFS transporter [Plantactinospora endophytica]
MPERQVVSTTVAGDRLGGAYWRYWAATTSTNLADGIRAGAFPLLAAALSGEPVGVAAVFAAQHGAWLVFGLYAGVLTDRHPPARILLVADVCRVAVLVLLLGCVAVEVATIGLLVAVAFVIGTAETFRDTAAPSLLPRLVGDRLLERAAGRLLSSEVLGNEFLGPLLGAALFAVATALPLATDGLVLALAVALVFSLPRTIRSAAPQPPRTVPAAPQPAPTAPAVPEPAPTVPAAPTPAPMVRAVPEPAPTVPAAPEPGMPNPVVAGSRLRAELGVGIRWLARHRQLRTVTASGTLLAFADAAWWAVLVVFATDVLHLPPAGYGLLLAAGAAGGAGGGLAAERLARYAGPVPLLTGAVLVAGLPALALAVAPPLPIVLPVLALSSAGFAVWNVIAFSNRQRRTPAHLFGRVTSVHRVALCGGSTLGALAGGWVTSAISLTAMFALAGAVTVVAAAVQASAWGADGAGSPSRTGPPC